MKEDEKPTHADNVFIFENGSNVTFINNNHGTIHCAPGSEPATHSGSSDVAASGDVSVNNDIASALLGFFYGSEENVQSFLVAVQGQKDSFICKYVNKLLSDDVISSFSYGKPLWQVLHDHKIYNATYSNWSKQMPAKKRL